MDALLLAWVKGIWPPAQRPDHVARYRYTRTDSDEEWTIVISETDVREVHTAGGTVLENVSRLPLSGETLMHWFSRRHLELAGDGWRLEMLGTTMNVHHTPRDTSGGWISGACI